MYKYKYISKNDNYNKYIKKIESFLSDLIIEYPYHDVWFNAVSNELKNKSKEREIIFVTNELDNIIAVSILKNASVEQKICTFRVAEQYQHQGIGTSLMEKSLYALGTNKPIITVSGSKQKEFVSLFDKFHFTIEKVYYEKYAPLSIEYCYNGILSTETILFNKKLKEIDGTKNSIA